MATSPLREAIRDTASDWFSGHAASALRTCAVAPRRGLGGPGAPWIPGRASRNWGGTRVPGQDARALRGGQWRSQRSLCSTGPSPPPGSASAAIVAGASGLSVRATGNDVTDARAGGLRGGEHGVNAAMGCPRAEEELGDLLERGGDGRQGQHICCAGPCKQLALVTRLCGQVLQVLLPLRPVGGFFRHPGFSVFRRNCLL